MQVHEKLFIGGEWVDPAGSGVIEVISPHTEEVVGRVPEGTTADVDRAVEAARRAFDEGEWPRLSPEERIAAVQRFADAYAARMMDLAEVITTEMGSPISFSQLAQTPAPWMMLNSFIETAKAYEWEEERKGALGSPVIVRSEGVGVVGAIVPWNVPQFVTMSKLAPALLSGSTIVIKPSPETPLDAMVMAEILEEAGIPKGVVNVVTGSAGEIGDELCTNPIVKKITFTGSTEVGKILIEKSASTVKKVSMELGGNAPFLVFDDADIDRAVEGAVVAKYRNSGQTCVCTNRFFVQAGVYDAFVEKLAAASNKLKVGPGLEEGVQQGPLIDENAVEKVEELIADAADKGGKVVAGGKRHELGGSFFQPTVIAGATPEMRFMKEEIFGPVAPVFKFETEEEAVALANDTEYGLACYFYTGDLGRAFRVMEGLKYGMVGVNEGLITTPEAPFGGVKESGLGREGGHQGIEDYLDTKYVCIGGLGL